MVQILLIGLGAGATSALLFATLATGRAATVILFYLTPLPILLAGIAWSHLAGLIAALSAAGLLAGFLGSWFFLAFLVSIGAPAYALAYLALLARPAANGGGTRLEWYPPGRLLLAAALVTATATALTIPAFGMDLETYRATLKSVFERVLRAQSAAPPGTPLSFPGIEDTDAFLGNLAIAMPLIAAALATITTAANLWLAGRIAHASGRLKRPWPDLPSLTLPHAAPILLLVALALSFLPNLIGLAASIYAAALVVAYAILGLCIIHSISRRYAMRLPLLVLVWGAVLLFIWPTIILAMLGLADGFLDFRGRAGGAFHPPDNPSNS